MGRCTQWLLAAMGALMGMLLAYIDSLPKWDDTGMLVGSLLLVSGVLSLLGARRPWLIALAVGIWIPLRTVYLAHDFRTLIVLLFPLVGAYAGWLLRLGLSKTVRGT